VRCFKRGSENAKKQGTPGSGCLSGRPDQQVTRPWEDGPPLSPLFPLIAFFSFASFHAQIRRTPPLAFESTTTPATHSRIRLLLQFEPLSSHSKPFSITNPGTFGLLLGLGRFLFFMSLSPKLHS